MASEKFRRQLRAESEQWLQDGLISPEIRSRLAERYQLSGLEQEASRQFLNVLLGLGGTLLGLGAITFVAANWQGMAPLLKVVLLLGGLISVNSCGFWLWNDPRSPSRQRWGHALLLSGVLLLGANLGLLPQIFHQSGPVYGLFLVWGLCVALMAAGLRLTSLAIATLILLMIGYFSYGVFNAWGMQGEPQGLGELLIAWMPLVLLGVFWPLARGCQSRWVFGLGAIALTWTFSNNIAFYSYSYNSFIPGWLKLSALFLPSALLWSYDARQWRLAIRRPAIAREEPTLQGPSFRQIARGIALLSLAANLYGLSFYGLWQPSPGGMFEFGSDAGTALSWIPWVDVLLLLLLAMVGWVGLLRQWPRFNPLQLRALSSGLVALLIAVPIALIGWVGLVQPLPVLAPFVINVALALMAIGLIRDGLALGLRSCFWAGMGLLVLDITTRMFEYDTALMLKAFIFALCGIAVIVAGIWFEQKVQGRHAIA